MTSNFNLHATAFPSAQSIICPCAFGTGFNASLHKIYNVFIIYKITQFMYILVHVHVYAVYSVY